MVPAMEVNRTITSSKRYVNSTDRMPASSEMSSCAIQKFRPQTLNFKRLTLNLLKPPRCPARLS